MRINFPIPPDGTVSRRVYREDPYTLEVIPPKLVLLAEVPVFNEDGKRITSIEIPPMGEVMTAGRRVP